MVNAICHVVFFEMQNWRQFSGLDTDHYYIKVDWCRVMN